LINTDPNDTCRRIEALGDGDVGGIRRNRGSEGRGVLVRPGLDIKARSSERVQENWRLQLRAVRRGFLDLDQRVLDHHLAHRLVRLEGARRVTLLIRLIVRGLHGGKEVSRVDDEGNAANLTETERGLEKRDEEMIIRLKR
jgi:hypothetical protein